MDKLSIINRALGMIGCPPITSPEAPVSKEGKHLVGIFDQCRRELLRRYPWNFAEVWTEVERTTAPAFYYTDAYSLPPQFLRLLWVGDFERPLVDYRLLLQPEPDNRRVIACNNSSAPKMKIGYTADITLYPLWDPLAIKSFAIWLALDAAKNITGQDSQISSLLKLLSEELKDAVAVDGQEQAIREMTWSNVQNARDQAQFGAGFGFADVRGFY
ncbi:MAG: hypothetical protein K2Y32_00295 [Candidatus Obscuribacterales bacterium]|nr:hypothetical protein [Candidatus Obscuribacterales bacterium]